MSKDELITLLRSVGVDENTITVMGNAFDIGYDYAKTEKPAPPVDDGVNYWKDASKMVYLNKEKTWL